MIKTYKRYDKVRVMARYCCKDQAAYVYDVVDKDGLLTVQCSKDNDVLHFVWSRDVIPYFSRQQRLDNGYYGT